MRPVYIAPSLLAMNKNDFKGEIKKFSVGRYFATKILSKLTFGSLQKKLSSEYVEQKHLYRLIKKNKL